ncbi:MULTISPECIES: group II intron reverse transcriptase/maturase [Streptomyces]|uniref:Group II intron reverse transcriptase/maturase n=1 Tax=Streptomyces tsukubensis (strain DSM 42081 / NBRC 108919 / NRRL 18488 / 9993) TaxID=1114943 RepID=I2N6Q5_STRT9|nr:group II intron reverse transcriptase/maturase [Streptomyces tsukubensis]MYS67827.1 group II intron reverse transcriptase/maturase [Streptomyces sp. SID5473]AZK96634.1 group II intron reverse transcriptase/maturase [Streptomyces tsukubensis]EIF92702.1 RNA-directed DNA polymerase [Streptomyces tsukubensis NRRL18488]QKM67364.1 group II intron reverse transcriptase/maturase [Streptomyces tsukubensis NRRL18488]TAI42067.1 group II intron reverse transcriptase/maturase [Streptomyces tsukubensis]
MNTDELEWALMKAERRVLEIQAKLHRWATDDPSRRFDDLFNLVCDPAFLLIAWSRVRSNRGARSAGVDGLTATGVEVRYGLEEFLGVLRADLKTGAFRPMPVRERMIPKAGGKLRRLGIPTVRDRVVQAALKLVLEPIFEADFKPCSYGFRPNRRAQDAIAEIHHYGTSLYHWVLEADITACFDEIDHTALLGRVRDRVGDKRVLGLVKAFLKAGILSEGQMVRRTDTGTPQGGILSPLLANIALSVLDEFFAEQWQAAGSNSTARTRHRRRGGATYRLVRYADDFVVMVAGTKAHAEAIRQKVTKVLSPMGLRLSEEKTSVVHLDEGFTFLGFRIQRQQQKGSGKRYVYTWPSDKALTSVKHKVKAIAKQTTNVSLGTLLRRINQVLRGWTAYFQHGVSSRTFHYLSHYVWWLVGRWLRKKHRRASRKQLRRRYQVDRWLWADPTENVRLYLAASREVTRYRFRGERIPTPWAEQAARQLG